LRVRPEVEETGEVEEKVEKITEEKTTEGEEVEERKRDEL